MKGLYVVIGALMIGGCATSPKIHSFENAETFDAPFDKVWPIVNGLSKESKWPIDKIEGGKDSGILVSGWVRDEKNGGDYGEGGFRERKKPGSGFTVVVY